MSRTSCRPNSVTQRPGCTSRSRCSPLISKMCDRDGVGSVEIARLASPDSACHSAVAAEQVVLPTPPLPRNMCTRAAVAAVGLGLGAVRLLRCLLRRPHHGLPATDWPPLHLCAGARHNREMPAHPGAGADRGGVTRIMGGCNGTETGTHRGRRARVGRESRRAARQGRCLRHRRHHARQVHLARQVPLVARRRLRLLRRRAGLGLPGPALRQREVHRLAHRISRRAGPHPAGHLPRAAVRGQRAVLPRRVLAAERDRLPARAVATGPRARTIDGLRGVRRLRVRVLRLQ